jgi:pimeloyl-ACP methyl ester carboxylesterase
MAHQRVGEGSRVAVFLHGILGNKQNLKGFARRVSERSTTLACVVADMRGHGASHGFTPPHTVAACASDVLGLAPAPALVVGHSFGGKVALELVRATREALVVLDAPPGARQLAPDGELHRLLRALRTMRPPFASRRSVVEAVQSAGLSLAIAQWMTTNLVSDGEALRFAFDLDVVEQLLASFATLDLWPVVEDAASRIDGPVVWMVVAGQGGRFTQADTDRLFALAKNGGRLRVDVMPEAGHWLHTEDPEGLLALLSPLLSRTQLT